MNTLEPPTPRAPTQQELFTGLESGSKLVKLGEVAEFIRGVTFKPEDKVEPFSQGSVVCFRTTNVQAVLDQDDLIAIPRELVKRSEQFVREGDILVSTANSWNLVGKCCWVPQLEYTASIGGFISTLRPNPAVILPKYLYYWFSSESIQTKVRSFGNQTTNISNMNIQRCLDLEIPLPPLETQKQIAAILDAADALRAKRRESLQKLDELLKSVFLEMFGDPVENPRGWKRVTFGSLLDRIDSGWSPVCQERNAQGDEWGVLKLGAVTSCYYKDTENKALLDGVTPRPNLEVKSGDLLFSRKNTYELVAACALVEETRERLMLPDLIFRFVFRETAPVTPEYIWGLLTWPSKRKTVQSLANGAAGSMPNISKGSLLQLPIELPPLDKQVEFARWYQKLSRKKQTARESLSHLEALFASLQQRAFG